MHICRWINKEQMWDIYLVWLDGAGLARHSQASVFCWGCTGGRNKSRSEHNALRAEIRCLFLVSIVRRGSDVALSWQKWAACVISVQMVGKMKNVRLATDFCVRSCLDGVLQADISALCFSSNPSDTTPKLEFGANMPIPQHGVWAQAQPCAHHCCFMFGLELLPVRLAPEWVSISLQDTIKAYLEMLRSQSFGWVCIPAC